MNFNIYLDDEMARQLQKETQISHLSRNAIIREAINSWLNNKKKQWPEEILNYQGDADFSSFERYREELEKIKDDPFL